MSELKPRAERLASLRERAREMEEVLKEEGFEQDGSHAVFVRWQRQSIEELGELLFEAEQTFGKLMEVMCRRLEETKALGDKEVGRLKIMFAGGEKAIALGKQAAETAIAASERAEKEFQRSVAQIAKELSSRLIESSQDWLVLKQTSRNRRDAWMLALAVSVTAVGIFIGGYVARVFQDDRVLSGFAEIEAKLGQCRQNAVQVRDGRGVIRTACWLDELAPKPRL
ncbi:hypothetical protein SAMN06265338_1473 [Rhodoblastus acidophilus]|uniref:Uncharacterized protein n=1 Tax=Rhodoblastus acidophilus TaxID=1074 RepID=A0A212SHL0_RHOAC|nr:hypothetical protein [Rhodoblastus acidophilus]PPQ34649.1 hypothetical protein CKO16_22245 [Rhodoblastus acidophilus]RAI16319.1 hypothetical protein CH337_22025 [Rhodoblastus acidophilus]SNB85197.1 hypothetical protein SAMN06265338_1473 [Rhodoblastus acidophilus]